MIADPDRHPPTRRRAGEQRRHFLAWAEQCERMADQLHATVCRLRSRATMLRDRASAADL